jgi:hypothetical protein
MLKIDSQIIGKFEDDRLSRLSKLERAPTVTSGRRGRGNYHSGKPSHIISNFCAAEFDQGADNKLIRLLNLSRLCFVRSAYRETMQCN